MQVKDLLEKVQGNIKDSTNEVAELVIKSITDREVAARKDAFLTVLAKLEEARKAEKKIQPDIVTHPVVDGAPAKEPVKHFSPTKMKELTQNKQDQEKLEGALNKALDGDFSKVKELAGKGGKPAESEE